MTDFAAQTIVDAVVNVAWRSTLILLIAFAATRVISNLSPRRRREIGVTSLIIVATITLATLATTLHALRHPPTTTLSRLIGGPGEVQILTPFATNDASLWLEIALGAWGIGTLVALTRTVVRFIQANRIVAASSLVGDANLATALERLSQNVGVKPAPDVRQSAAIRSAAVFGFQRKTILISNTWQTWSDERRDQILMHELSHIANHDLGTTLVAQATRALLWWNPIVLFAVRNLTLDQEFLCDEVVVQSGTPADSYAETLLDLAKSSPLHPQSVVLGVAGSAIRERVERILTSPYAEQPGWHRWYTRIAVTALMIAASVAGPRSERNDVVERIIDVRTPEGAQSRNIRVDRDGSGNIRVTPTAPAPQR